MAGDPAEAQSARRRWTEQVLGVQFHEQDSPAYDRITALLGRLRGVLDRCGATMAALPQSVPAAGTNPAPQAPQQDLTAAWESWIKAADLAAAVQAGLETANHRFQALLSSASFDRATAPTGGKAPPPLDFSRLDAVTEVVASARQALADCEARFSALTVRIPE